MHVIRKVQSMYMYDTMVITLTAFSAITTFDFVFSTFYRACLLITAKLHVFYKRGRRVNRGPT